MKTVWKLTLPFVSGEHERVMPEGAEIVHAGIYKDELCVWFECNTGPPETRHFLVAHTGDLLPDEAQHVITCYDSTFIWHVYVRPVKSQEGKL